MPNKNLFFLKSALLILLLFSIEAHASVSGTHIMENVLTDYRFAISRWGTVFKDSATWLYWTLITISMIWTFGIMALRKADLAEYFTELFKFLMFTGFFWWLLTNGPNFSKDIMNSLRIIAGKASKTVSGAEAGVGITPSDILDIGFSIFDKTLAASSIWSPIDSSVAITMGVVTLIITAIISVNMLLLLISGYFLAYAGVFFLGFGGSKWTSDMAINYYKTVLGLGAQLMTMILLIGVGKTLFSQYTSRLSIGISYEELGVMLVVAVTLLMLTNQLPSLIAGIITGSSVGGSGIGQYGGGSAMAAASTMAAAATTMAAAATSMAGGAIGGVSAIKEAFSQASSNVSEGSDIMSGFGGDSGGGGLDGLESSAYADAAGEAPQGDDSSSNDGQDGTSGQDGGSGSGQDGSSGQDGETDDGGNQEDDNVDAGSDQSEFDPAEAENAGAFSEDALSENDALESSNTQSNDSDSDSENQKNSSKLGTAGRIAADTVSNLVGGTLSMAKQKTSDSISETKGGKLAQAIKESNKNRGGSPVFEGNSIGGDKKFTDSQKEEIASFRDKK